MSSTFSDHFEYTNYPDSLIKIMQLVFRNQSERITDPCHKHTTNINRSSTFKHNTRNGFTLLEVIIAITIGSVIILTCTTALRMGLSHLSRGEDWLNDTVRGATAYDFFWQQVSSIRSYELPTPSDLIPRLENSNIKEDTDNKDKKTSEPKKEKEKKKEKKKKVYFKGDVNSLSFITPLSIKKHYGYGLIVATYSLNIDYEGTDLIYREKRLTPAVLLALANNIFEWDEEDEGIVIAKKCDDVKFEYLKPDNRSGINDDNNFDDKYQEWVGILENQLPKAIRIIITKDEAEKELLAPIMVMYSL